MPRNSWLRLLLTPPTRADWPWLRGLLISAAVCAAVLVLAPKEWLVGRGPWLGRAAPLIAALGAVWTWRSMRVLLRPVAWHSNAADRLWRRAARLETIGLPVATTVALAYAWRPTPLLMVSAALLLTGTVGLASRWRQRAVAHDAAFRAVSPVPMP